MTLQKAILSGKRFKLHSFTYWIKLENRSLVWDSEILIDPVDLSTDEILSDEWIIEKKWYEGDFKKRYPHGVICKVSNDEKKWINVIITNFNDNNFYEINGIHWKYAEQVPENEMPYLWMNDLKD